MTESKKRYFAFSYSEDKYVLGLTIGDWTWFYDYYFDNPEAINFIKLDKLKELFVLYRSNLSDFEKVIELSPHLFSKDEEKTQEILNIYFDEESNEFKAELTKENKLTTRKAIHSESKMYSEIIASQKCTEEELKQRLLEVSLGFVPEFQYKVEQLYDRYFLNYKKSLNDLDPNFTSKVRNKAFEQLFKELVIPLGNIHGFERHTKTSKRLFKKLDNGLSIFILFNFISFGYGSYEVSILYFDDDIGNFEDDEYLAWITPNFPYHSNSMIESYNLELLKFETTRWMRIMELYLFPFLNKHKTHKAILSNIENMEILGKSKTETQKNKPIYSFEFRSPFKKEKYINLLRKKYNE
jgi:hypothetical protein